MKLAVIILNWNNSKETKDCVQALSSWFDIQPSIWIVDNASEENDIEALKEEYSEHHLIRNETNKGFAGGNNTALKHILEQDIEYVLLLNNDSSIREQDVKTLVKSLHDDDNIGAIGPLISENETLYAGGRNIAQNIYTRIKHDPTGMSKEEFVHVDYIPGTVFLTRTKIFKEVGLLDEDYFFSGEIADLCERIRKHGYSCTVNTKAKAEHHIDTASPLRESMYTYYTLRNRFLFIRKNMNSQKLLIMRWAILGTLMLTKASLKGKTQKARAIRMAISDGLNGKYGNNNEQFIS